MRFSILCVLAFSLLFAGGCATVLNGDTQAVTFNSDPEGGMVRIDGVAYGRTPCTVQVPRKGFDKAVEISLEGYKSEVFTLKNNAINGATLLNVLWFPGAIVDGISGRGGSYDSTVTVALEKGVGTNNRIAVKKEESPTAPTASTSMN